MKGIPVLFIISVLLFLLISLRDLLNLELPNLLLFYGNDFLCMPIVLSICLIVSRSIKKEPGIYLSLFTILSLTTFYAIFFEVFLPKVGQDYTADLVDVIMYFAGGFLFYSVQNLERKQKSSAEKAPK
jgi:hypothetical protein